MEVIVNKKMDVYISGLLVCIVDEIEQWVYDSLGYIYSKVVMGQCLMGNGGSVKVILIDCVVNNVV